MSKRRRVLFVFLYLSLLSSCGLTPHQKNAEIAETDCWESGKLQPYPKDSVKMGILWSWHRRKMVCSYTCDELLAIRLHNMGSVAITYDSIYEIGAWRSEDSTYTLLYRDTLTRKLYVNAHSEVSDTIYPGVKDVYRHKSGFSEYLLSIRTWGEGCDTVKLAYHIAEPILWYEQGQAILSVGDWNPREERFQECPTMMRIDIGTNYDKLMDRTYIPLMRQ